MKLSKTQQQVLSKMKQGKEYSAYQLGCSLNTLNALTRKGLLKCRRDTGSWFAPRSQIKFWLR